MNKIKIYQVDAFTNKLFSGNPAAVCPLDKWLPDEVMQSIALENNYSETAFFIKNQKKFSIRWFTPEVEIGLCGHATLAAAHILFTEMDFQEDIVEFKTNSGEILKVKKNNNILKMDFPSHDPKITDQNLEEVSQALGILPVSFYFCNYGLAVFNNEEDIIKIRPNFSILEKLPYDGIIVTAPGEKVDFVSRFFGPKLGIPEDPVTGGAHCVLIPYWSKRLNKKDMFARQLSKRGGELHCSFLGDRVYIGGQATTYLKGELLLNNIKT